MLGGYCRLKLEENGWGGICGKGVLHNTHITKSEEEGFNMILVDYGGT